MSTFLFRLGRACFRHKWRVLAIWLVLVIGMGLAAFGFKGKFDDSFSIPGTEAQAALTQLRNTFPQVAGATAQMVIVAPEGKRVDTEEAKKNIDQALQDISHFSYVNATLSPFDPMINGQVSKDGQAAIAQIKINKSVSEVTAEQRQEITNRADQLQAKLPGFTVKMGGEVYSVHMPKVSMLDIAGVAVALIVLLFTLGSLIAAMMPLGTAIMGAGISMAILLLSTRVLEINSTSPILALMLALAVGIDYALFILSRHRDQLAQGAEVEESAAESVATAGSAVVFAGATVVIALLGLFVVKLPFLAVMGAFAALAVAISVIIALTLLPAFMGIAGERMRPRQPKKTDPKIAQRRAARLAKQGRAADRWVRIVTKVPLLTIVIVVAGLGALAIPAKDMVLALPNAGRSPIAATDRQAFDLASKYFGPGQGGPILVTAELVNSKDPLGVMAKLKADLEKVPGVHSVPLATPNQNADTGVAMVVPNTGPDDKATKDLVHRLRDREPTWQNDLGVKTAVTGYAAASIDVAEQLGKALLPFGAFVVGLSVLLLTIVFRSILVPIKAALGYILSVGSAFGLTTLVFNQGWAKQLVNLQETLPIIAFFPIMFMGILFGLAMDYEVFLVSRMREDHVHGATAREAVRSGFVHSAKVVVAAALIMFSVFAFFVPLGDAQIIKPISFGLAVGILIDAFIVRMTLVPAVMWLLKDAAWWLPKWLDRLLPSLDIEGESLRHQVSLAHWPRPDANESIYAEGLGVNLGGEPLVSNMNLSIQPGETVVYIDPDPVRRTALLTMLTGRLKPDDGEAKVLGKVLSTQSSEIRKHAIYVDQLTHDPERSWRTGELVAVDDADQLVKNHRDAIVNLIKHREDRTILLGVADPTALAPVLQACDYTIINAPAPTHSQGDHHVHA